jgi:bacterioferritin-associated ferredoxin
MIICVCHRVSDRDIARAAREGCTSFDELQFELQVATCCGKCHDSARQTLEHHVAQVAAAQRQPARIDTPGHRRVIPITGPRLLDAPATAGA